MKTIDLVFARIATNKISIKIDLDHAVHVLRAMRDLMIDLFGFTKYL